MIGRTKPLTQLDLDHCILPLEWAESDFLQVLVRHFELSSQGRGVQFEFEFGNDQDALWLREAKGQLIAGTANFESESKRVQRLYDEWLAGPRPAQSFDLGSFGLRYASGGTLPIIRITEWDQSQKRTVSREYYCFIYREVFPVGWNIANGGSDSVDELLHPDVTIEREFNEELLILDRDKKRRYVLDEDLDRVMDRPEFVQARKLWDKRLHLGLDDYEVTGMPIKWLSGPDSVVATKDDEGVLTSGLFFNITAEDFSIEVDKVAKIQIDATTVLCDGEILLGHLVNAPIGLFEVSRFNEELKSGNRDFRPDIVFHDAVRRDGTRLQRVVDRWIQNEVGRWSHGVDLSDYEEAVSNGSQFDLCPITRRMVERFNEYTEQTETQGPPSSPRPDGGYDAFVSYAEPDHTAASQVFQRLTRDGSKSVYFAPHRLESDFSRAIDDALESSTRLVVVATHLDHLMRNWVEYEWRSFHNCILSNLKPQGSALIPFISGIDPYRMPLPLRRGTAITFDPTGMDPQLDQLIRWFDSQHPAKG